VTRPYQRPPRIVQAFVEAAFLALIPAYVLYEYTGAQNKASCVDALVSKSGVQRWQAEEKCSDADNKNNNGAGNWLLLTFLICPLAYVFGEKDN